MFHRITAVVLLVRDFQRCLTFYRDTLELEVVQLEEQFAAFRLQDQDFAIQAVEPSAAMVNLPVDAFEPGSGKTNRVLLCTRVPNVDSAYNSLRAKGVVFTGPPVDQAWGIRTVYFHDPEGNLWEFAHPLTP